ncbi:hypothetical protein chiPu_0025138, partial [Chiloscyllium punctatum]|nr:hypothetical protein [Chiloscyllium punctatum]
VSPLFEKLDPVRIEELRNKYRGQKVTAEARPVPGERESTDPKDLRELVSKQVRG